MADQDRVTVTRAATMVKLPVRTLHRAVAEGEVPSVLVRGHRRVLLADVEAWMESKRRELWKPCANSCPDRADHSTWG